MCASELKQQTHLCSRQLPASPQLTSTCSSNNRFVVAPTTDCSLHRVSGKPAAEGRNAV